MAVSRCLATFTACATRIAAAAACTAAVAITTRLAATAAGDGCGSVRSLVHDPELEAEMLAQGVRRMRRVSSEPAIAADGCVRIFLRGA